VLYKLKDAKTHKSQMQGLYIKIINTIKKQYKIFIIIPIAVNNIFLFLLFYFQS